MPGKLGGWVGCCFKDVTSTGWYLTVDFLFEISELQKIGKDREREFCQRAIFISSFEYVWMVLPVLPAFSIRYNSWGHPVPHDPTRPRQRPRRSPAQKPWRATSESKWLKPLQLCGPLACSVSVCLRFSLSSQSLNLHSGSDTLRHQSHRIYFFVGVLIVSDEMHSWLGTCSVRLWRQKGGCTSPWCCWQWKSL